MKAFEDYTQEEINSIFAELHSIAETAIESIQANCDEDEKEEIDLVEELDSHSDIRQDLRDELEELVIDTFFK